MAEARKAWIDSMSDLQITARAITLRERVPADVIENTFDNKILEKVAYTWQSTLNRVYSNSHYIIISVPDRPDALKDLNYASQSLLATLSEYGVRAMYEDEHSPAEESPFHVFTRICSPVSRPDPKVGNAEGAQLNELLTSDHIHFTGEEGVIRYFSGDKEMLAITMGIRSAGDYMDESMVASLLAIDCELTLLHNIKPIYRPAARALLIQQRNMARVTSFSQDVIDQYSEAMSAIEDSDANYQALTQYSMSMILFGKDKEEIDFAESEVQRICRLFGVTPVREGWVTQATFFNQFPAFTANFEYLLINFFIASLTASFAL
jgi:type IV secretory pathway VirB4 component